MKIIENGVQMTNDVVLPAPDKKFEEIGEVSADEDTPCFEKFKFKAFHDKSASPGTFVAIEITKNKFLLGRVVKAHEHNPHYSAEQLSVMHSLNAKPEHPGEEYSFTIYRSYEAEVIDEIHLIDNMPIARAAETMPKAGSRVIIPPNEFICALLGLQTDEKDGLILGNVATTISSESKMSVILNKNVIQRHIFIGGTTGGGKSYSAKVLAEEIHKYNIPMIFFDTQYEFVPIAEKLKGHVLVPGKNYTVKLSSLTPDELSELVPTLTNELHVNILINSFLRLQETNSSFGLAELEAMIRQVATEMGGSTPKSAENFVIPRTRYHIMSYDFLGDNFGWKSVLKPGAIIDINCGGISRQRLQLILASTLRELQTLRKEKKILPYIVFVDEAHLFVPQDEDSACKQIIREGVRIGRHHGISFVLITQSPIDIDKKAIRQCNTRLLFAIEPDQLIALQGVKSDATEEMLNRLPKSPIGTCILSGTYETIKHAIPVKIRKMHTLDADGGQAPDIFSEVNSDGRK